VAEFQGGVTSSRPVEFDIAEQVWPLDKPFRISRGSRTEARVVVVTITDGEHTGRGEAVPARRYNETVTSVKAALEKIFPKLERNVDRQLVQEILPAGPARNALDCAVWDLEAKRSGKRAWELASIPVTDQVVTAFTISLNTPEEMAAAAKAHADSPMLKLKLGGDLLDLSRVKAVRHETPRVRLIVDANESWSPSHYEKIAPELNQLGVELIEQPFPADTDEVLANLDHPIPVCADESCHTTADLPRLVNRYEAINAKLDKTGGLTEALKLCAQARQSGFKVLIGCMVCTSLGIAPARLLASSADYLDIDGPLLLAGDRHHPLPYHDGNVGLPPRELWG
jgi:L-alanine-DL-glutamate epimerase-like enolase superfamily enzyme